MASFALWRKLPTRIVEGSEREQIIIAGVYGGDRSLCALELGLTELDDGAEAKLVSRLGQGKSLSRLFVELVGNGDTAECCPRVKNRDAHIAGDCVGEFLCLLLRRLLSEPCFFCLRVDAEASEERDGEVDRAGRIPVGNEDIIGSNGSDASSRPRADGRKVLQLLGVVLFQAYLDAVCIPDLGV